MSLRTSCGIGVNQVNLILMNLPDIKHLITIGITATAVYLIQKFIVASGTIEPFAQSADMSVEIVTFKEEKV